MFKFDQLSQIHLEITNNCQARCPMCTRNVHGGVKNPFLKLTDWSLGDYQTIITRDIINQVRMIYFCGNYGDPLLNNDLLDMGEGIFLGFLSDKRFIVMALLFFAFVIYILFTQGIQGLIHFHFND